MSCKESNAIVGPVRWGYDVAVRNYETNQYAGGGGMVRDRRYARALATCLGLGWDTPAGATRATEAVELPPIIVRASPQTAGPIEDAVTRTLIERAEIDSSEERDLNGLIRGLPGVTLQTLGSRGNLSTLFVRGASSGLGQISFDGVPLYSSVNGAFNLSSFPADALGRIEVVRGASSPRYGSRALGGVIRLQSRDAQEDGGFLHLEGGSYGTLSETAGGGLAGPQARASVTVSRDDIFEDISAADPRNGNSERDGFRTTQGVARLSAQPSAAFTVDSSVLYQQSRAEIDTPGLLPTGRIGLVDARGAFAREETWVAQTTATLDLLPSWDSNVQLGFTRNRVSGRAFDRPFGFDQRLFFARWTNTQAIYRGTSEERGPATAPHLDLFWGAELQQEEGENQFDLPGRALHGSRTLFSGLLELRAASGPWAGFLGTSLDHYDDLGTHPTLYAGVSRWATPTLKLRASGGRGYRPPAFHELFFLPLFGNPSLVPEQGWSADLGFDWEPDTGTRLSMTGFYHRYANLIQLTFAPTLSLFVAENVPDARIWGFELEGSHHWDHGVTTGMDYTYADSRDLGTHRALPRRPDHQGRAYAEWELSALPLTLWLELVYRGSHFDDKNGSFRVGEGVYLNAQLSYRISPQLRFYLRGENLNDDRSPETFSFGARGAAVFGGIRLELF
ncbi:MAG: TonB-dependent receptor plug domain-containing protein [Gammaproteobacteria bacterium]